MAVVINSNVSAMSSMRLLGVSADHLARSLARLSSGSRIVSPEDDAAGLAQSIKFDAQINRTSAANTNVQNAISFSQTRDGFLQKVQKALDRMSELSVQAQDSTKTNADLSNYQAEFSQLQNYISDIEQKRFNDVRLFGNVFPAGSTIDAPLADFAVTIDSDATTIGITAVGLSGGTATGILNAYSGISISTSTAAYAALNNVKTAIQSLAAMRAFVGANLQRLRLTSEQLSVLNENLTAANSRIKDVDVAQESTQLAKYKILAESGIAMLAQANAIPISVLQLLG